MSKKCQQWACKYGLQRSEAEELQVSMHDVRYEYTGFFCRIMLHAALIFFRKFRVLFAKQTWCFHCFPFSVIIISFWLCRQESKLSSFFPSETMSLLLVCRRRKNDCQNGKRKKTLIFSSSGRKLAHRIAFMEVHTLNNQSQTKPRLLLKHKSCNTYILKKTMLRRIGFLKVFKHALRVTQILRLLNVYALFWGTKWISFPFFEFHFTFPICHD